MFLTTILSKCHPKMLSYTYTINNNLLIMTPVNSGYSELGGFIQSVSSTTLVIKFVFGYFHAVWLFFK